MAVTPIPYSVPGCSPATQRDGRRVSEAGVAPSTRRSLTGDGGSGGLPRASWEQLLSVARSGDGAVLHQIASDVGLAVGPLQSDAVVSLGQALKVQGGVQGYRGEMRSLSHQGISGFCPTTHVAAALR